jgi:hypothetical protein
MRLYEEAGPSSTVLVINTIQYEPPNPFNQAYEEFFLILAMFLQVYLKANTSI